MIKIKPSQNRWKNSTWILAGILLLSLVGNWFQINLRKNDRIAAELSEFRNQTEIAGHRALAKSFGDRAKEVDSLRVLERDSAKIAQRAAKIENQAIRKTLSRLRPLLAPKIDSIPDLRDFVALQDSLINGQDSLIMSLEFSCMAQVRSFEEVIRLNRAQIQEQIAVSNTLQEMLVSEQGKTRKAERGKRFWKRTAGVITVVAAAVVTIVTLKE